MLLFKATTLLSVLQAALAASRTSPPAGALVVRSGTTTSGEYATISSAVAALPDDSTSQSIFIYSGTYKEQVDITRSGPIYGYTTNTADYTNNVVTISASATLDSAGSDDASGTLRVHKDNFALYNVNVKNTHGSGVQAIAYSNYGSKTGAYGCGFYGYQDTLLAEEGTQVYLKSYIEGATDFIFGQRGQAYFEGNTIAINGPDATITASGRSSDDDTSYVFNSNTVSLASDAASGTSGTVYFGRPWADYAKVIFKNTDVTVGLESALWSEWSSSDPRTDHILFADYGTTGSGASNLDRASFATLLTESEAAAYDISSAVGSDYADWVDTSYLA
ncbi:carbohydrate esterase family 8 protein [Plicaturopsis crispa FD-325 SS-3]|nr:carbohydrate esterase family 8 protein [Plicaturopsis crispa FD-325 SS-3]